MIAGHLHWRCHQDRKIGNSLLQLLVASDFDGSGRKTCKNDDDDLIGKKNENASQVKWILTEPCVFQVLGRLGGFEGV